jgi:MFS family permease
MLRIGRVYYGWVIVAVISLSSLASAAQINPTIGVFLKPITEEFNWSRSALAGAVALGTLVGGFAALGVGPLIDRFGARWILLGSFFVSGGALMALGGVSRLWQLYAAIFVSRVALQGAINLTNQTVVAKWFIRRRGRAMAFATLGQRIGSGAIPFLAQQIILVSSWRIAAVGIGMLVWALTLVPVSLWLRRQPQDLGLLPDGARPEDEDSQDGKVIGQPEMERSYTVKEALRTRPFWVILVAFCLTNFVNTGINFNLVPHLTDSGLTESQAVTVLLVWALMSVPATLGFGVLAEKMSVRYLMMVSSVGVAGGILLFLLVDGFPLGLLFAVIHGASFGGSFLVLQLLLADYFGSASLGALRGFILPWQMVANAMGPLTATLVFDITGGYTPIFVAYIALQGVLLLALLLGLPSGNRWEASTRSSK